MSREHETRHVVRERYAEAMDLIHADRQTRRARRARVMLIACLAAAALLFFWPSGTLIHGLNLRLWLTLRHAGLPPYLTPEAVEQAMNVVVFFALTVLTLESFPRWRPSWVVLGAVATSLMIEAVQGLVLAERLMEVNDVVANSLGAVLGAVVTGMYRWHWRRSRGILTS